MKATMLTLLLAAAIVLPGCGQSTDTTETASDTTTNTTVTEETTAADTASDTTETTTEETTTSEDGTYTLEEVAEHSTEDDCWMVLDDGVYDVTEYIASHPGGDEILRGCGLDATEYFNDRDGEGEGHSAVADTIKEDYRIGDLAE